jgi:hypothetical protein
MTLVSREDRPFQMPHGYNPEPERIRKAGRIWDILAQKYPEQKERIDRIRGTSGPMLGPASSSIDPGFIKDNPISGPIDPGFIKNNPFNGSIDPGFIKPVPSMKRGWRDHHW